MNISTKLKLTTFGSLFSLIIVGCISLLIMNNLSDELNHSNNNVVPEMQAVYEMKSSQQEIAIKVLRHIMATNAEDMAKSEADINKAKNLLQKALSDYARIVDTKEGKEFLRLENEAAEDYLKLLPELLDHSKNFYKDAAVAESVNLAATRQKLVSVIAKNIEYNNKDADEHNELALAKSERNLIISISIIILSIIIIGIANVVINRGIAKSLTSIQIAIKRIEGDLDFTKEVEVLGNDEISKVALALNCLQNKLKESLSSIFEKTNTVSQSSSLLSVASNEVANAATHQSDSASSMAASIEELSVSINHISDRARDAHKLSSESNKYSIDGEEIVTQTVTDISKIAESVNAASERITELETNTAQISLVVNVIREVAEQTNLLALNAAIEAARAGEQGRGFAVVADEVRKLAERTATSTKEISIMIESIKKVSRQAVDTMSEAVMLADIGVQHTGKAISAISSIRDSSKQTMFIVEEITAAINEQSQASTDVASGVENIAQMAEESSVAAKNSAETASDLDKIAIEMKDIVNQYKL